MNYFGLYLNKILDNRIKGVKSYLVSYIINKFTIIVNQLKAIVSLQYEKT